VFWVHWSTKTLAVVVEKFCALAPSCPAALTVAWFEIVPSTVPATVALNATVVDEPAAMVPPAAAVAPVPKRTWTVREADRYSP
jgi:hypothetical protein